MVAAVILQYPTILHEFLSINEVIMPDFGHIGFILDDMSVLVSTTANKPQLSAGPKQNCNESNAKLPASLETLHYDHSGEQNGEVSCTLTWR